MRDAERIAALEDRVEILEACLAEIEVRLKLKRKPLTERPPRQRPMPPRRQGSPTGPVIRAVE
jgi:hypothetical protein